MSPEVTQGIIIILLILVVSTLFYASFAMFNKKPSASDENDTTFMKSLGLRVMLSFATVGFVVLAAAMGWLEGS